MNEKVKQALESLEKLIEDISIDSGYSYPALYADIRTALYDFEEDKKELIAEQHRLFDLAKEQEEALKLIVKKGVVVGMCELKEVGLKEYNDFIGSKELELTQAEFDLVKKVVEKYGK